MFHCKSCRITIKLRSKALSGKRTTELTRSAAPLRMRKRSEARASPGGGRALGPLGPGGYPLLAGQTGGTPATTRAWWGGPLSGCRGTPPRGGSTPGTPLGGDPYIFKTKAIHDSFVLDCVEFRESGGRFLTTKFVVSRPRSGVSIVDVAASASSNE